MGFFDRVYDVEFDFEERPTAASGCKLCTIAALCYGSSSEPMDPDAGRLIYTGRCGSLWMRQPQGMPLVYIPHQHFARCVDQPNDMTSELRSVCGRLETAFPSDREQVAYVSIVSPDSQGHRYYEIHIPCDRSPFCSYDTLRGWFRKLHPCPESEHPLRNVARFFVEREDGANHKFSSASLMDALKTKAPVKQMLVSRNEKGRKGRFGHILWEEKVYLSPIRHVGPDGHTLSIHFF